MREFKEESLTIEVMDLAPEPEPEPDPDQNPDPDPEDPED